jgi:hypothetical protein
LGGGGGGEGSSNVPALIERKPGRAAFWEKMGVPQSSQKERPTVWPASDRLK